MEYTDNDIINLVENVGIGKVSNGQLIKAYRFITKKTLGGSCSECAKRKAMREILRYYNELKVMGL